MNRRVFFDAIRKPLFGRRIKRGQVEGIERILDYWQANWPKMPIEELAYVLATVKWETVHTFQPIEEGYPLKGEKLRAYQRGLHYYPAYGRGLVQTTWPANYARLGLNTPADYPKALEWDYALHFLFEGMIFGWFTGKKLSDYITPEQQDYVGARAIVNGEDHAKDIANYAVKLLVAIRAAISTLAVDVEKSKVSGAVKTGGALAGGGLITAGGANIAQGGDNTMSALSIAAGLASVIAPWIIERFKKPSTPIAEGPAPKPPPPEEASEIVQPAEIIHSETADYDFKKAHRIALEAETEVARREEEEARLKVVDRANKLYAIAGEAPKPKEALAIAMPTPEPAPALEGSPQ